MYIKDGLTFDDVLLIPKYSEINSRADVDISVDLGKGIKLRGPFINANMKSIASPKLVSNMFEFGMGILHRFDTIENQTRNYFEAITIAGELRLQSTVGISVGISSEKDNDIIINQTGTRIVCIDVAHGDHIRVLKETNRIAEKYPNVLLIVGNVATGIAACRLRDSGANVIKANVGSGSLCSTRIETGNGVPTMTAIQDIFISLGGNYSARPKIITDGGIRYAGDCVKSLCFSDAVMLGSVLSATDETPGEVVTLDGKNYKQYAGSSTHKTNRIEGVSGLVEAKGPMRVVLQKFKEGLESGLSYQGCKNLDELRQDPMFVRISNSGLKESHPHANLK